MWFRRHFGLDRCRNKRLAARVAGSARRREKAHPVATSPSVSDPERWRKRAKKLRAIAETLPIRTSERGSLESPTVMMFLPSEPSSAREQQASAGPR